MGKLKKEVLDLDGLRFMMNMLKEVRQRESGINMEINPIMNMYQVVHRLSRAPLPCYEDTRVFISDVVWQGWSMHRPWSGGIFVDGEGGSDPPSRYQLRTDELSPVAGPEDIVASDGIEGSFVGGSVCRA